MHRASLFATEVDLLSERIFASKILPREDLVDDRDKGCGRDVIIADHAAADDGGAKNSRIFCADSRDPRVSGIGGIFRLADDLKT